MSDNCGRSSSTIKPALTVEIAEYAPRGGDRVMIWVNQRRTDLGGYSIESVPRHIAPKLVAAMQADAAPVDPAPAIPALVRSAVIAILPQSILRGLFSRDGFGSYSRATFEKLHNAGLCDNNYHWTDKGNALRVALGIIEGTGHE